MYTREHKGQSLRALPRDFTVLDLETTGLDPTFDSIIEISAIRVRDLHSVETYSALVNPGYPLPEYITQLTGITDDDLADAPGIEAVLPDALAFVGGDTVLGQNVNFDINFLYDKSESVMDRPFVNDFVDLLRLSRIAYPDLPHHRLMDTAAACSVDYTNAHRALRDCEITLDCYRHIVAGKEEADFFRRAARKDHPLPVANPEADPSGPLYGKVFVFTGALERMTRAEAMEIVAGFGGVCANSVSKKINYLVLGNTDYNHIMRGAKSSKLVKAEQLILQGQDIMILSENVFFDLVESTK